MSIDADNIKYFEKRGVSASVVSVFNNIQKESIDASDMAPPFGEEDEFED